MHTYLLILALPNYLPHNLFTVLSRLTPITPDSWQHHLIIGPIYYTARGSNQFSTSIKSTYSTIIYLSLHIFN
jgi:hypothetical protein